MKDPTPFLRRSALCASQHSGLSTQDFFAGGGSVSVSWMARPDGEGNEVHEFHYVPFHVMGHYTM